ncbi:MAG: hypothetical protein ACI4QV_05465 [Acutalibacteraceae bacterium]
MKTDIPKNGEAAELIYKTVGERKIELTFLPPICNIYEKAPVYFVIAGGGWHTEARASMLGHSRISIELL